MIVIFRTPSGLTFEPGGNSAPVVFQVLTARAWRVENDRLYLGRLKEPFTAEGIATAAHRRWFRLRVCGGKPQTNRTRAMDLTRLYQPPSNATLLAATSPLFELSTRVAAIAQLRERKGLTREQRQLFEMSLAEIVEDVRRAGLVKARGLAYVVNDSGQLVSALPLT